MNIDQLGTHRNAAIKAGADALANQQTPEIWRSFEALAEAVIDAAHDHLVTETVTTQHDQTELFA